MLLSFTCKNILLYIFLYYIYFVFVYLILLFMKDKKLIAFDMYGTFVAPPTWLNPYKEIFSQLWIAWQLYKELSYRLQTIDTDIVSLLPKEFHSAAYDLLPKFQSDVEKQISSLYIYKDFLPTLEKLKMDWYRTAVVSNLSKPYTYPLTNLIPLDTFDYQILSYAVGMQKPDKKIFDLLATISGCTPNEIVMVGDSLSSDILWAKNAGIDAIHIDRTSLAIQTRDWYTSISTLSQLLEIGKRKKN